MFEIKVGNIFSDISGRLPEELYLKLERKMSFRPQGFQFMPMYNRWIIKDGKRVRRMWDGWRKQIWKRRNGGYYFPTGLFGIVKDFFEEHNIERCYINCRTKPEPVLDLRINESIENRDYQQEIINKAILQERGIIIAATGSGKTIISAGIIQKLKVSPFLFFVTSIDLLDQAKESLEEVLNIGGKRIKVGQIGGGTIDIRDINVMTVQTAVRALGEKWDSKHKFDNDDTADNTPIEKRKDDIVKLLNTAKGAICDECINGDAIVTTKSGPVRMDKLYKYIGKEILSFCSKNGIGWKKITHFYKKGKRKTLKITLSNGMSIRCTDDHLIMTNLEWKMAKNIRKNDLVLYSTKKSLAYNINFSAVKSIESYCNEPVFDITVEDTHCFFANGILVHNCQHWKAETCQLVVRSLKNAYYTYGLSATPYREQGDDLMINACFGKVISNVPASYLIKQGWLIKPSIKIVHIKNEKSKFRQWQQIYKDQVSENEEYNQLVSNITNGYIKHGRLVLVLIQQIKHGQKLEKMIPGSVFLSGKSSRKKRQKYITKLRNQEISCIIASVIFDEGVDIRALDTVVLAGQGCSKVRAMQRIGRILRPCKETGKTVATAIDFRIHQKYLLNHSLEREKMYRTESEFDIEEINP